MQFNSVKGNNNVAAGQAAGNTVANIYDTSRKTAPDFTKIAKTSIESRSKERVAATRAETQVARQGIASNALVKGTKAAAESNEKVNKTIGGAKRFAGIVGGLGTIATASILHNQDAQQAAIDKKEYDAFMTEMRSRWEASDLRWQQWLDDKKNNPPTIGGASNTDDPKPEAPEGAPAAQTPAVDPSTNGGNSTSTSATASNASDTTSKYMATLTSAGLNPAASAALAGHLRYESADFQALEEFEPNSYGTRGYGHLQWTDIPGGSQRRTNFMDWSAQQGLDPSSFEANSGFLVHEMQTNFNQSWTNGGSWNGLNAITDVEEASKYLQDNYIRPNPAVANSPQRIQYGRQALTSWRGR